MADVFDISRLILDKVGYVSTMKLQKLAFYSQALSLVETGKPLFHEQFQAWVNGPVCYELFKSHRGKYIVGPGELGASIPGAVDSYGQTVVDRVVKILGDRSGQELSALTHAEKPWSDARVGCGEQDRCDTVISTEAIRSYYSSHLCSNPLFVAA